MSTTCSRTRSCELKRVNDVRRANFEDPRCAGELLALLGVWSERVRSEGVSWFSAEVEKGEESSGIGVL